MKTKIRKVKTETERAYVRRISLKLGKPMGGHSYNVIVPETPTEFLNENIVYGDWMKTVKLDMIMILELHMGVKLTDLPPKLALRMCIRVYGKEVVKELATFAGVHSTPFAVFCASRE